METPNKETLPLGLASVRGFGVELRLVTDADLALLCQWRNAPEVRAFTEDERLVTPKVLQVWLNSSSTLNTIYPYIAYIENKPFGFVEFKKIDFASCSCEWGMFLASEYIGTGLGLYLTLCQEIALKKLRLDTLISKIQHLNTQSIRFFEFLGAAFTHQEDDFLVYTTPQEIRQERLKQVAQLLKLTEEWERHFPNTNDGNLPE